jgi:HAD superfamily hydrolase (TIGR01509 family)
MRCVVLDAMGVMFRAADDVAELLIPFVRANRGDTGAESIQSRYVEASLGTISADEFWRAVGLPPSVEDAYLARHTLMTGTREFLHRASELCVPVWCLSNDVERWSRKLRTRLGIDGLLSGTVISSDARARKPAADIYRYLLARSGYSAADLLFVDDRPANVEAARALGIPALQFGPDTGYRDLTRRLRRACNRR